MRTLHKATAGLAVGLLAVGSLAGCGKSKSALPSDPKTALVASLTNLGNASTASLSISLRDPNGSLLKAMSKDSTAKEIAIAKRVLAGTIKLSLAGTGGAKISDVKAKHDFSAELTEGSTTDFSMTFIAGDLYLHIDKAFLTEAAGEEAITSLKEIAPALASGGTIKIPGIVKSVTDFTKAMGGGASASAQPTPSVDPQAIAADIKAAFTSAITVTKSSSNTYAMSVAVKPLATAFVSLGTRYATMFAGSAAASGLSSAQAGLAKIPDGSITGTVTVSGDKATEIVVDLNSVGALVKSSDPKADVPDLTGAQLVIAFGTATTGIAAPAGATEFDLSSLLGGLFRATRGMGDSQSGASSALPPCSEIPASMAGKIPCSK